MSTPNQKPLTVMVRMFDLHGIENIEGKKVLDVGCFRGEDSIALREYYRADVWGIDRGIAPGIKRVLGERFIHSSMQELPEAFHGTFDIVYESGVLPYNSKTLEKFIAMEAAALKPDGFLVSSYEPSIDATTLTEEVANRLPEIYGRYFRKVELAELRPGAEIYSLRASGPIRSKTPLAETRGQADRQEQQL